LDWESWNCSNCQKGGYYADKEQQREWVWRCEIQEQMSAAFWNDDNAVSAPIAARMGLLSNPGSHKWRCNELVEIMPTEEYYRRYLKPPATRLRPLRQRLRSALSATWEFWIKPWDREDHDYYEGLRSPWLAWSVAWHIHHDARERIK
jgi:hypothetical protein